MSLGGDPAVSVCFLVIMDGQDLGLFNSCEGLGVEVTVESRHEGGNNDFAYQLPGQVKYTNIKLTRPLNADSGNVAAWISSVGPGFSRSTGQIQAMTLAGLPVCTWSLQSVMPIKWTGPQLTTESPKLATETLEIAHHGFVVNG